MGFLTAIVWLGQAFWDLLLQWLFAIFIAPFENFNMLWVLVPIYLSWITSELFQEKHGTSLGNAITNGIIPLWAGMDWIRTTIQALSTSRVKVSAWAIVPRFFVAACVLTYGIWIIYEGVKGRSLSRYIGRIRTVTYIVVLFTPVFYGVIALTWGYVLSLVLFFPLFYYTIELLDEKLPDPMSIEEERKNA